MPTTDSRLIGAVGDKKANLPLQNITIRYIGGRRKGP